MRDSEFYKSKDKEKYPPDGRLHLCRKCLCMHVDNWNPDTFLPILEELDTPYVPQRWAQAIQANLDKGVPVTTTSVMGRYVSMNKLNQFKD